MSHPHQQGCEGDGWSVGLDGLVVAGCDATPVLRPVEAASHHVAPRVDLLVEGRGGRPPRVPRRPGPGRPLFGLLRHGGGPARSRLRCLQHPLEDAVLGPPAETGVQRGPRSYHSGTSRQATPVRNVHPIPLRTIRSSNRLRPHNDSGSSGRTNSRSATGGSWRHVLRPHSTIRGQKKLKQGVHRSVQALERDIRSRLVDLN